MKESFDQESGDQEAQKEQLCVNIIKCYFRGNFCSKFVLKSCFVVSLRKAIESCAYCNMFTDRPYVEASVVSTGLKSTLQRSLQFRPVFSLAVFRYGSYLESAKHARA